VGLFESELFGHERGAFTDAREAKPGKFEVAHRGTLFLDEIDELPMEAQAKLLRVLETRQVTRLGAVRSVEVDVRLIAATSADLEALAGGTTFRRDLFYRLNVVTINLPPLRQRREDLGVLVDYFLTRLRHERGVEFTLTAGAREALSRHDWPAIPGRVCMFPRMAHSRRVAQVQALLSYRERRRLVLHDQPNKQLQHVKKHLGLYSVLVATAVLGPPAVASYPYSDLPLIPRTPSQGVFTPRPVIGGVTRLPGEYRVLPNGRLGRRLGSTNFYSSIDPIEQPYDPVPESDDRGQQHGPSEAPRMALNWQLGCSATIWSEDESYWTFTDEMRLFDPGDDQLSFSTNWVYKPALTGAVAANLTDPSEGDYTCKADWWVESEYLGYDEITIQVNYLCSGDTPRTTIRAEYKARNIGESLWPACSDLQTNYSSTYFSSGELNNNGWHELFWSTSAQRTGLDATRTAYGAAITTSNAYRCPDKNVSVGGASGSLHQFGRAADLVPVGEAMTQSWRDTIRNHAAATSGNVEAIDETDHVHVAW
jgi:hypothetical protein